MVSQKQISKPQKIKNRNKLHKELGYGLVKFFNTYNKLSPKEQRLPYKEMKSTFLYNTKKSPSKKRSTKRRSPSKKRSTKRRSPSKKRSTKRRSP